MLQLNVAILDTFHDWGSSTIFDRVDMTCIEKNKAPGLDFKCMFVNAPTT